MIRVRGAMKTSLVLVCPKSFRRTTIGDGDDDSYYGRLCLGDPCLIHQLM